MAIERIIGYQWGGEGRYIGPYEFENNMDQEAVHLPRNTALDAPPSEVPTGHVVVRDVARGRWEIRAIPAPALVIVRHADEVPND
ncbi:MAG: hypothetical protein WKG03_00745 [Telluria sp.]